MRFTSPKRVLSWWWSMSTTSCACSRSAGSGPSRRSFAQSTRDDDAAPRSPGSGRARSRRSRHELVLVRERHRRRRGTWPRPCRARAARASWRGASRGRRRPGFSWVVTMKRSLLRRASATAARSASWCSSGVELIDQPGEAHPPLDRRIVLKGQLWGSLQVELAVHAALEDAVRGVSPASVASRFFLAPSTLT